MSDVEREAPDLAGEVEERDGLLIEWDVGIPMDDGIVLRCDVFRPSGAQEPVPAILTHGPYAKGMAFQVGYARQWQQMAREAPDALSGSSNRYQNWETPDPEKWVPHGYACVRVDSRGAGSSPGVLDAWSAQEIKDLYTCIEWAASQPWCTGKVGMCGISYYAQNAWQVSGLHPPHLAAIVAWEGASDFYRELFYHGGMRSRFVSIWFPRQVVTVQHGQGSRVPPNPHTGRPVAGTVTLSDEELVANRRDLAADAADHPLEDDWHRARSPRPELTDVPLLSAANWGGQGLHPRGNFEGFLAASTSKKWLEAHGGTHFTEFYTDYGRRMQQRFLDHFLKGEENGWEDEPRVRLQVRHADGTFTERHEAEWPLARTAWTRFHLDPSSMALRADQPGQGAVSYASSSDGLTFLAEPQERPLELTGPGSAHLRIASSTIDADLFVIVRVFDPSGKEVVYQGSNDPHTPVAQGWLRASHRRLDLDRSLPYRPFHPHDRVEPLEPGRPYEVEVEIWPTSIVIPPGYRLAVTVRGKDYEYGGEIAEAYRSIGYTGCAEFVHKDDQDPQVFDNEVTLHAGGEGGSYVLLPVIPGSPHR